MTEQKKHHEKPRYYATDFPELLEHIAQDDRKLFLQYTQQKGEYKSLASAEKAETVTLRQLMLITQGAIASIPGTGIDVRVTCPNPACGKRHCYVKRDNGIWHCWSCDSKGCLEEMKSLLGKGGNYINRQYYSDARQKQNERKDKHYVPMTADDYHEIDIEHRTWLYPIYPFADEEQQARYMQHFHPNDSTPNRKDSRPLLRQESLESLQAYAQRYVEAMGWDPEVVRREGLMCAWLYLQADPSQADTFQGKPTVGAKIEVPAIAYCNRLYGSIINVKFRSILPHPVTGEWSKDFLQLSPTKPCAPYGIDSICPLRPEATHIDRLIITEGEKDRITLLSCGYRYVLSIANGAQTNVEESHEAFEEWIRQAEQIVICGDTDRPGRALVSQLLEQYKSMARVTSLPRGKKDISEVYAAFGAEEVRRIIDEAQLVTAENIFDLEEHADGIMQYMMGHYDHGYDVGMGKLTDGIFHPTDAGGLIIITGIPNSGKTDFLNCLMTHLMYHCHKRVGFFSFEKPCKEMHVCEIARIALGVNDTSNMDETTTPEEAMLIGKKTLSYLGEHMVDFDTHQRLPDSNEIIAIAEGEMKARKHKIDYVVIDPYVFINMTEGGNRATETEKVRLMLTKLQAWSRSRHIWTVVVAHPRIQNKEGSQDFPDLNIYSIAGSAQWGNLADFLFTVRRVNKPEEGKVFTIVEMVKVRDQQFCHLGKVYYTRQRCGRYEERASENDCVREYNNPNLYQKDESAW